ncbi:hypothetical protein E2C01_061801 [Portunus trituberculatus]|uniref:Uncharacterized protein n=1 Tax=Portunus trituberculatus TaxID=210409 RepID=A0A5B7HGB9_PORTR|nr:hypothetical protein [Portunus trituberculatus]
MASSSSLPNSPGEVRGADANKKDALAYRNSGTAHADQKTRPQGGEVPLCLFSPVSPSPQVSGRRRVCSAPQNPPLPETRRLNAGCNGPH